MKQLLLASAIIIISCASISCKKKRDDPKPTPIPLPTPTLVGSWTNNVKTHNKPTFTEDSLRWDNGKPERYIASADSIYGYYANNTRFVQFGYKISKNNDTLWLQSLGAVNNHELKTYWRVK